METQIIESKYKSRWNLYICKIKVYSKFFGKKDKAVFKCACGDQVGFPQIVDFWVDP